VCSGMLFEEVAGKNRAGVLFVVCSILFAMVRTENEEEILFSVSWEKMKIMFTFHDFGPFLVNGQSASRTCCFE